MKILYKTNYKQRFFGYYFLSGVIEILDGIITIVVAPFNYTCILYTKFSEWNLIQDMKRAKNFRSALESVLSAKLIIEYNSTTGGIVPDNEIPKFVEDILILAEEKNSKSCKPFNIVIGSFNMLDVFRQAIKENKIEYDKVKLKYKNIYYSFNPDGSILFEKNIVHDSRLKNSQIIQFPNNQLYKKIRRLFIMSAHCPYCNEELEDDINVTWLWYNNDLDTFEYDCPNCGKKMKVDVIMNPEFIVHKVVDTYLQMFYIAKVWDKVNALIGEGES